MQIAMRRRLAPTPLAVLAVAALLDLGGAARFAQLGREEPSGPCSCDCCEVEQSRDDAADGNPDLNLVCSYTPPGDLYKETRPESAKCGTLCISEGDTILSASESGELDTQRFCFFECAPGPGNDDGADVPPRIGDACRPLAKSEAKAAQDTSGNAKPLFLSRRVAVIGGAPSPASSAASSPASSSASAPAPGPAQSCEPWCSIADPMPEHVARFMEWADATKKKAEEAEADAEAVSKLSEKAADALPTALGAVEEAMSSAQEAHEAEVKVRKILEAARKEARAEAMSVVPQVLKEVQDKARAKVKAADAAKAAAYKNRLLQQVPVAAEKAMKPYTEAMNRAVATSAI